MNIHFTIQQQKKGLNFMNSLVVKFLISFYDKEGCYKLKFLNTKNIINIGKYLILFFYACISQNDYYNNLYKKNKKL